MSEIDKALSQIVARMDKQIGDHPKTHLTLGDLYVAEAILLLAKEVERVADVINDVVYGHSTISTSGG